MSTRCQIVVVEGEVIGQEVAAEGAKVLRTIATRLAGLTFAFSPAHSAPPIRKISTYTPNP